MKGIRMKRRMLLLIIIVISITSFCLVRYLVLNSGLKPDISVSSIDLSGVSIPITWDCAWCEKQRLADWRYETHVNDVYTEKDPIARGMDNNKYELSLHNWIDQNHGYVIQTLIVDYEKPSMARWNYDVADPTGRFSKTCWNFTYSKDDIYPKSWSYTNPASDESVAECCWGTEEMCTGWFYQARYGQYYVLINFVQDIDYRGFQEIVKAINEEFLKQIQE